LWVSVRNLRIRGVREDPIDVGNERFRSDFAVSDDIIIVIIGIVIGDLSTNRRERSKDGAGAGDG
jgi:hypothetical protein